MSEEIFLAAASQSKPSPGTFPQPRVVTTHQKQLWEGSDLAVGMQATAATSQRRCQSRLASFAAHAPCPTRVSVGCCSSASPSSAGPGFPPPAGNPPSFGKLSKRVHEPKGLQFPSPAGAMERAPQGISPSELGTAAAAPMQEMWLFVPRRHYGSRADSKHIPPISNCAYILTLICQQVLLWKPLCSDPFSDAPCLIPLHRGTNRCPTFSLGWPASTQREQMPF